MLTHSETYLSSATCVFVWLLLVISEFLFEQACMTSLIVNHLIEKYNIPDVRLTDI